MFRIGNGYDVHKLVFKRRLILCGEEIPFSKGLLGHSDADVATHAAIDALLGAAALGDIGQHFPDNDVKFKDINSLELLTKTVALLEKSNFCICNMDLTIVAQRPKLAPFILKMRENLQQILKIEINRISVKATTEEGLGITKKESCIACFASCLLQTKNL